MANDAKEYIEFYKFKYGEEAASALKKRLESLPEDEFNAAVRDLYRSPDIELEMFKDERKRGKALSDKKGEYGGGATADTLNLGSELLNAFTGAKLQKDAKTDLDELAESQMRARLLSADLNRTEQDFTPRTKPEAPDRPIDTGNMYENNTALVGGDMTLSDDGRLITPNSLSPIEQDAEMANILSSAVDEYGGQTTYGSIPKPAAPIESTTSPFDLAQQKAAAAQLQRDDTARKGLASQDANRKRLAEVNSELGMFGGYFSSMPASERARLKEEQKQLNAGRTGGMS
tara:strand:+ start:1047 stop:1910 length:864 start_codon:yes stop_codon:yes gene_type:complete